MEVDIYNTLSGVKSEGSEEEKYLFDPEKQEKEINIGDVVIENDGNSYLVADPDEFDYEFLVVDLDKHPSVRKYCTYDEMIESEMWSRNSVKRVLSLEEWQRNQDLS